MDRSIVAFDQDDEEHWFARLDCGHNQHVRHNPPLESRPWVNTIEGRADNIGEALSCVRCDRLEVPDGYEPYNRVSFNDATVPKKFLSDHTVKVGVWGLLSVQGGAVTFVANDLNLSIDLRAGDEIAIAPELPHYIQVDGAEFTVTFLRPRERPHG